MKPKPKTKTELDQLAHNEALNINEIINPYGIPAEVYEVSSPIIEKHTCGALLKHHLGYICPECGKITK